MTAQQYKAKRESLGLTQQEAAERLGVFRETIARRETGKSEITGEAEIALNAIKKKKKGKGDSK